MFRQNFQLSSSDLISLKLLILISSRFRQYITGEARSSLHPITAPQPTCRFICELDKNTPPKVIINHDDGS
jgi:hypothetical protein